MAKRSAASRALAGLLRRMEPRMARQLARALSGLRASLSRDRIERAVTARSEFALRDLVGTLPRRLAPSEPTVRKAFDAGIDAGRATLGFTFAGVDRFSVREARRAAGQFVTGVTEETRRAIRQVVVESFTAGITPRETAARVREIVGLTPRQSQAVITRRSALLREGHSQAEAGRRARRYAERLLGRRAETIARTEIMRAANAGQRASWAAAVETGHMSARSEKVWIVAPDDRLCPYCEPLEGARTPLDGKFDTSLGLLDGPPLHPNCRCTLGVVPVSVNRGSAAA